MLVGTLTTSSSHGSTVLGLGFTGVGRGHQGFDDPELGVKKSQQPLSTKLEGSVSQKDVSTLAPQFSWHGSTKLLQLLQAHLRTPAGSPLMHCSSK